MTNDKCEFQKMVHDFHLGIGQEYNQELRIKLIQEEAEEFIDAVTDRDVIEAIDALCDILYVVYGTADVLDIALDTSEAPKTKLGSKIDWALISSELRDFTSCVGGVVTEIRADHKALAVKNSLEELANGCWKAGAAALGVDLRPFLMEVHRTNMHKLTGPKREDGKQLKPPGWKPPRIGAMYDRLQQGRTPQCNDNCEAKQIKHSRRLSDLYYQKFLQTHPDGGFSCMYCGGLIVEIMDESPDLYHLKSDAKNDV